MKNPNYIPSYWDEGQKPDKLVKWWKKGFFKRYLRKRFYRRIIKQSK